MTKRTRSHRETDILARRLERAAQVIPTIFDHLNEQRANITTMSSGAGEGGGSKGDHSDPTLRTVSELDSINLHQRAIDDQVHCVHVAVNLLDEACRNALGKRAAYEPSLVERICNRATCNRHVSYRLGDDGGTTLDDLCDVHRIEQNDLDRRANEANGRRARRYKETA